MGQVVNMRGARPSGWNKDRWEWMQLVIADCSLSPMARLIAVCLAQRFANNQTAECRPGLPALMASVAAPKRTVLGALADLKNEGWIAAAGGHAPGRAATYRFLWPETQPKSVRNPAPDQVRRVAPEQVQIEARTGADFGTPPTPPYMEEPEMNHTEPVHPRVAIRGLPRPTCATKLVTPESAEAQRWDDWLAERGYPPLARIGQRDLVTSHYEMPVTCAPDRSNTVAHGIAVRFADWLRSRA